MDSCALVKIAFYSKPEMSVWFWKVICWYQNGGCIFDRTGCFSDLLQLVLRIYDCRFLERSSISWIVIRCFYQNYAHWKLMVLGDKLFHRKKIMKMLVKYKSIKMACDHKRKGTHFTSFQHHPHLNIVHLVLSVQFVWKWPIFYPYLWQVDDH
jgi:hypothetical protein